jgi:Flp pilus assembly protein TadB
MAVVFDNAAVLAAIVAVLCALLLVGLRATSTWVGDRQLGGKGQTQLFREAARTGSIPSGAEHRVWGDLLERTTTRRERPGLLSPQVVAAILGIIAAAVLLLWIPPLVAVGIGVVVAAAATFLNRRVSRRQTRLLTALRQMG